MSPTANSNSSTLLYNKFIVRDEDTKAFQLSTKLLNMGYSALKMESLIEKSLGPMRVLRDKFGETIPLGILHGAEGLVIEELPGTFLFRFVLEPGKKFNLHTAAPGKAILAYLPSDERENLIERISFKKFTNRTILSKEDYKTNLKSVRKKGFAIDNAEEIEGMHCLAAPIFNRQKYPIAAIWITGPSSRVHAKDFNKIGKEVKMCADKISKRLG